MRCNMSKQKCAFGQPCDAKAKSRFNFRTKEAIMFYILISPFIAMLILMKLFPFIWGVIMSFTNFTGFNYDNLKFIGFNNYVRVLTDNFAIQSLQATAVIGLITVPMGLFISFALALLLNSKKKGVGIFPYDLLLSINHTRSGNWSDVAHSVQQRWRSFQRVARLLRDHSNQLAGPGVVPRIADHLHGVVGRRRYLDIFGRIKGYSE